MKTFLLIGVGPFLGGLMLLGIFVKSCVDLSKPENSESGDSWFGLGPPLVIGLGFLILGVVLMLFWRVQRRGVLPPQARGRRPGAARPERGMSGPIVLGYDGTEGARAAVHEARGSRRCSARTVVVAFGYEASPLGGEVSDLAAALHERGEQVTGRGGRDPARTPA